MKIFAFAGTRSHQLLGGLRVPGARQRAFPMGDVRLVTANPVCLDAAVIAEPAPTAPQVPVPLSRLRVKSLT